MALDANCALLARDETAGHRQTDNVHSSNQLRDDHAVYMRVATGGHWGARPPPVAAGAPPDENSADGITCLRSSTFM